MTVPNLVQIGQTAAEIWQFFDFLRWRQTLMVGTLMMAKLRPEPNFVEIGQTAAEIWRFFIFPIWRSPPSWTFKKI